MACVTSLITVTACAWCNIVNLALHSTAVHDAHADPAGDQDKQVPNLTGTIFTAVENTDKVHNLLVCTLCSCYPLAVLGMSPPWYKSRSYRSRAVRGPRGVLKEFGTELSPDVAVRVHDSTADMR